MITQVLVPVMCEPAELLPEKSGLATNPESQRSFYPVTRSNGVEPFTSPRGTSLGLLHIHMVVLADSLSVYVAAARSLGPEGTPNL